LSAKRQKRGAPPIGEEAEIANADEAFGEQVQQEAAQELIQRLGSSVSVRCGEQNRVGWKRPGRIRWLPVFRPHKRKKVDGC